MVDYYKILEVTQSASNGEIKKAYRKLALKWHPDKNPDNLDEANKRFKEISEAYEVLIDDRKRRIYDQYGKDGLQQMPGGKRRHEDDLDFSFDSTFVFRDPEEVFREFFGGTPFDEIFAGFQSRGSNRHPVNTLSTSIFGPFSFFPSRFGDMFGGNNTMSSFSTITNYGGPSSGQAEMKRTSMSTRFINGKKITTKKTYENGKETIMSYENDVLTSKTVNGVPQPITLNEASTSRHVTDKAAADIHSAGNQSSKSMHNDYPKGSRIKTHHLHHHPHSSVKHDKTKRK